LATYRDGYFESGWMRFLRRLSASFRLGHFFRVEVRVYWLTIVLLPLILLFDFGRFDLSALTTIALVAIVTLGLYVVVWSHEMGHILAARRYGIWTPLITLSPMGGVAHLSTAPAHPRAEILISLAGPAVHLVWLAAFWPLSFLGDPWVYGSAGWQPHLLFFTVDLLVQLNLWLLAFNLLPFFPMDGGRVLRAWLSGRMHPNRATLIAVRIGQVGAVAIGIAGLVMGELRGSILLLIGLSNFFACRRELMMARHSVGPYAAAEPRQPWESDPDAWKQSGSTDYAKPPGTKEPGRIGKWRAARSEKAKIKKLQEEDRLNAELDRVLDRVHEVGMAGLSAKERRILERVSKARRKRD
jgi:Zn-dependent protease